jgi:hypothetical protein
MELPSIHIDIRKKVILKFQEYLNFTDARQLEAFCHSHRCIQGSTEGIPIWSYNNLTLYETNGPNEHERYASYVYNYHVCRLLERLKETNDATIDNLFYDTTKSKEYFDFENKYRSKIQKAKEVLSEKNTSSTGIFKCSKCGSYDVRHGTETNSICR